MDVTVAKCEKSNNDGLWGARTDEIEGEASVGPSQPPSQGRDTPAPGAFTDAEGRPTDDAEQGYYGRQAREPKGNGGMPLEEDLKVAKEGSGEKAQVQDAPVMVSTNGGTEPMSSRQIQEHVVWCEELAYWRFSKDALDAGALDAELRARLRKEVPPERVEIEFQRIMKVVQG